MDVDFGQNVKTEANFGLLFKWERKVKIQKKEKNSRIFKD